MIFVLTLAALASDDLAQKLEAEAPAARARLKTCRHDRCARADAARAAFLVALDTYVTTGRADGALAAAVRQLDPELFRDLPDVLVEAATEEPGWVHTRVVDEPAVVVAAREGKLKPGFYRSLEELRTNTPSVAWTDPELRPSNAVEVEGSVIVHYQLAREDVRDLGRPRIVGLSDGTDVYVVYKGGRRRAGAELYPVSLAGDAAVYEVGAIFPLPVGPVPLLLPTRELRELDLADGSDELLTLDAVRERLADRPELLAAFEDEERPRAMMREYAVRALRPSR